MSAKPLYRQIQQYLQEQILSGKLRPGDRVPSEKELSQYFKVSQITSKQALAALADANMVIRIKGKGTFVAGRSDTDLLHSIQSGLKGIVGIIFPSIHMPIESLLFYFIQTLLHERGYQTLIRVTDDTMQKEMEAIRMFGLFGVRGYLIFPAIDESYNEEILRLSLNKFPHVLVDRYFPSITSSSVASDNIVGTVKMIHGLLDAGHKNIGFLTQQATNSNAHERIAGFEKAFTDRELPIDKKFWFFAGKGRNDKETIARLKRFFETHPEMDAVVAIDAVIATLAYGVLQQIGRTIPDKIKLVSYDDPKLPFVPFIKQNIESIANHAVDILIRQMESTYQVERVTVPVRLVEDVTYPLPRDLRDADGVSYL
ncbi:GntR family transcriptional regulator [Cohnella endophytica]|uniref:GntR family transcriptional regulator n=1 Tax=Cohnella endophytica TaxID=2419778 RepID=A0A494XQL4_9BACL|nr:GntR family transcriptional regulator [Cohnella endophytica]RKP52918.1 GntR family transcriptional regulator [Cohnella endophytica]